MIKDRLMKLKAQATVGKHGLPPIDKGAEFHIVMDVVYMEGNMIPPELQTTFYDWIIDNPDIFTSLSR